MNPILIHKGDDTIFADVTKFLTFNIDTALDLEGFKAQFTLAYIEKTIDDISSKSFDVVLTASDTAKLWLGEQNGKLILFDSVGNRKTILTTIPFLITNDVVENEYQEIDLDIPESSGVDIKVKVQGGGVTSVNGMTGDVIIGVPSIEGLATKEELDTKQDKGDYALIENIPTLVSQLDNDSGYTTQLDVMQAIASIPQFKLQIVDSLSKDNAEPMVLYLVSKGGSAPDVYDEYIWLEETGNFEFLGTTAVDLTGYVKNTDYATTSKGGVIKAYTQNGFGINNSGQPFSQTINLASYKNYGGNYFVGKGTLENIKYDLVKEGVVNNNISLGESDKQKVRNWIGASAEVIQHDSFASFPADRNMDKIFQYIGETTEEFVNGYFYKSVAGESNYVTSEPRALTFNYDLFWSELENAGITLDTLRLREEDKARGGFSIMGTSESETEYRVTNINGIDLDVLLTKSVQTTSDWVGQYTRWYYTYSTVYEWKPIEVQPEQDLTEYVKNTDYATTSKVGLIKASQTYSFNVKAENGNAQGMVVSLANYPSKDNTAFICKGTLDNVLTQYSKTVSLTQADYTALTTKDPNTLYLIEE